MNAVRRKVKRIDPLVKVRKNQLDHEAAILAAIRQDKHSTQSVLLKHQKQYVEGVNQLNQIRQSPDRTQLSLMEESLDHVKTLWYRALKKLREIEKQEQAQLAQLMIAQKNLKTMETLQDRYLDQAVAIDKQIEQKSLDEMAIKRFTTINAKK